MIPKMSKNSIIIIVVKNQLMWISPRVVLNEICNKRKYEFVVSPNNFLSYLSEIIAQTKRIMIKICSGNIRIKAKPAPKF